MSDDVLHMSVDVCGSRKQVLALLKQLLQETECDETFGYVRLEQDERSCLKLTKYRNLQESCVCLPDGRRGA